MANRNSTFEVRQGDTFSENLILENTATTTAIDLANTQIEAKILFSDGTVADLTTTIATAASGMFSITAPATDTATWEEDDHEGYITLVEAGVKTSSDNFTISVIKGAV